MNNLNKRIFDIEETIDKMFDMYIIAIKFDNAYDFAFFGHKEHDKKVIKARLYGILEFLTELMKYDEDKTIIIDKITDMMTKIDKE